MFGLSTNKKLKTAQSHIPNISFYKQALELGKERLNKKALPRINSLQEKSKNYHWLVMSVEEAGHYYKKGEAGRAKKKAVATQQHEPKQ